MIRLTRSRHRPDTNSVANKDAIRFGDLNIQGGHTAPSGFFSSVHLQHSFNGGLGGDTFGYAGGLVYRFANPVQCRHPVWRRGAVYPLYKEAIVANTSPIASSCAALRHHINTPGFAESKFLTQHFAAMCRADQLTILALVHSRAIAENKRQVQHANRNAVAVKGSI